MDNRTRPKLGLSVSGMTRKTRSSSRTDFLLCTGVGFYALFSICENPIVSSGSKITGFYWRGDQLFVKTATNEAGVTDRPWTTFTMELREPGPMPEPFEFARFLATCLGFTTKLRHLSMFFDSHVSSHGDGICSR